ncbi:MAG: cell envelope integrity protein TolA [Clostridia bacterium]|nr:cell envelope integrity protein TolA [Clostridia bacterium]
MSDILFYLKLLVSFLPFALFAFLNTKCNTKKEVRNRQYPMPVLAVVYSLILIIFMDKLSDLSLQLFYKIADLFDWMHLSMVGDFLRDLYTSWGTYLLLVLFNTFALIAYVFVKRIITLILGRIKVPRKNFIGSVVELFYSYDEQEDRWFIKDHYGQARTFIKAAYYGSCAVSGIALFVSCGLCMKNLISEPFYPAFAVIVVGELAFFIDGLRGDEKKSEFAMQADKSRHVAMYPMLRRPLKALFGDKLSTDGTTVNNGGISGGAVEDILIDLETNGGHIGKNYAAFIRKKTQQGLKPNVDYVRCGYDLANGKSLLFNTPFYDKLNPYVFYAMNRELLTGGKVLIVLGRHSTEEDLYAWCEEGMRQLSNIPDFWKISVLNGDKTHDDELPDIGIISRSGVHKLEIHKNNLMFLRKVSFVVVIEPSRLVTTAQIGLNLLIKCCGSERSITFCSVDRNCDGLVDALSHILMTNITEVSATEYPHGMSSYMYWTADSDYLQHRILPGVSRCLGMGTEISAVALKNQVRRTVWYGGDVFPVQDARWIAKQYYYDLLDYAHLPTNQETFDKCFQTSFNMCNEKVSDYSFVTVEDDRNNLFENRRNFATIAEQQGFVNVISSEYMLREYMAENPELFTADAKAIPYITADYARTKRNAILSLCMLMAIDSVEESVLRRQLELLNLDTSNMISALWNEICIIFSDYRRLELESGTPILVAQSNDGATVQFEKDTTIAFKRVYSVESGRFESVYAIENESFARIILDDLQNAGYIAEQESKDIYIGTELKGHVYQKYLPGQFFTLNGKYYEMVSTTADNRILVRRASEHIGGRLFYRQIRNYTIRHLEDSTSMGALRTVNNIGIYYQYADFEVETPGYWKLGAYNDFDKGALVTVNGVPNREYHHKQILKFDFSKFGDAFSDSVRITLTNLINETFVTLFGENQPFISAITPGSYDAPLTYSLNMQDSAEDYSKCIFIVEDSQLDIGLLIAVERNINRVFQIISDYLSWNTWLIEESRKTPPAEEAPVPFSVYDEEKPKKGIFSRIGNWFKGLFKKKSKKVPEEIAQDYMMIYGKPHKLVKGKWVACTQEEFDARMAKRHERLDEIKAAEKAIAEEEKAEKAKAESENTDTESAPEVLETPTPAQAEESEPNSVAKKTRAERKEEKRLQKLQRKQEKAARKEEKARLKQQAAEEKAKAETEAVSSEDAQPFIENEAEIEAVREEEVQPVTENEAETEIAAEEALEPEEIQNEGEVRENE